MGKYMDSTIYAVIKSRSRNQVFNHLTWENSTTRSA